MKVYDATVKICCKMTVEMSDGEYKGFWKEDSGEWYEIISYDINNSLEPIDESLSDKLDILWEEYQAQEKIPDNER